jgi:hypothetical protein
MILTAGFAAPAAQRRPITLPEGEMISTTFAFVFLTATAQAPSFGPLPNGGWADTPKGRFECQIEKGGIEVLKLDGKVIYQGYAPDVVKDGPIAEGFLAGDTSGVNCFNIIDNRAGYLVIQRAIAPPWYSLYDFAVIDFGASPPTIRELVEGDTPPGKSNEGIVRWKADGFSLRYYGLPVGVAHDSESAPKPALHELWFDFAAKKSTQVK